VPSRDSSEPWLNQILDRWPFDAYRSTVKGWFERKTTSGFFCQIVTMYFYLLATFWLLLTILFLAVWAWLFDIGSKAQPFHALPIGLLSVEAGGGGGFILAFILVLVPASAYARRFDDRHGRGSKRRRVRSEQPRTEPPAVAWIFRHDGKIMWAAGVAGASAWYVLFWFLLRTKP
jgi:hypothetical protein